MIIAGAYIDPLVFILIGVVLMLAIPLAAYYYAARNEQGEIDPWLLDAAKRQEEWNRKHNR